MHPAGSPATRSAKRHRIQARSCCGSGEAVRPDGRGPYGQGPRFQTVAPSTTSSNDHHPDHVRTTTAEAPWRSPASTRPLWLDRLWDSAGADREIARRRRGPPNRSRRPWHSYGASDRSRQVGSSDPRSPHRIDAVWRHAAWPSAAPTNALPTAPRRSGAPNHPPLRQTRRDGHSTPRCRVTSDRLHEARACIRCFHSRRECAPERNPHQPESRVPPTDMPY